MTEAMLFKNKTESMAIQTFIKMIKSIVDITSNNINLPSMTSENCSISKLNMGAIQPKK